MRCRWQQGSGCTREPRDVKHSTHSTENLEVTRSCGLGTKSLSDWIFVFFKLTIRQSGDACSENISRFESSTSNNSASRATLSSKVIICEGLLPTDAPFMAQELSSPLFSPSEYTEDISSDQTPLRPPQMAHWELHLFRLNWWYVVQIWAVSASVGCQVYSK